MTKTGPVNTWPEGEEGLAERISGNMNEKGKILGKNTDQDFRTRPTMINLRKDM